MNYEVYMAFVTPGAGNAAPAAATTDAGSEDAAPEQHAPWAWFGLAGLATGEARDVVSLLEGCLWDPCNVKQPHVNSPHL